MLIYVSIFSGRQSCEHMRHSRYMARPEPSGSSKQKTVSLHMMRNWRRRQEISHLSCSVDVIFENIDMCPEELGLKKGRNFDKLFHRHE